MANILKFKLGASLFSICILSLIPLYKNKFYAEASIKRWSKLSWDDFQGFVKPFTGYGAVVSSQVYLEFDSASSQFRAFAGQNNMLSWTKESAIESPYEAYSLNHEQYHFNVTELHARLMNEYIDDNPGKSEEYYNWHLESIHSKLSIMQDRYDYESNHSLIVDQQRRWEYKIDSLLLLHSSDSGWITDYYSGATVYFTDKPEFLTGSSENESAYIYRGYNLSKYDMTLAVAAFQYQSFDVNSSKENLYEFYKDRSMEIKSLSIDTSKYEFEAIVIAHDTVNRTNFHMWVYEFPFTYKLTAIYSNAGSDTTGYFEIANSFINSFKIVNTDTYWIDRFEKSTNTITHNSITRNAGGNDRGSYCLTYGEEKQIGFYRGPIFREDGSLLLVFDNVTHADSLLFNDILIVNKDLFTSKPDSTDHILFIPKDKLPNNNTKIDFGYLLLKDSVNKCYDFHYQSLKREPK